jgi:membrane protein implicated in regulation of membrane protease activity
MDLSLLPEGHEGELVDWLTNQGQSRCKVQGVYWPARLYQANEPVCLPPGTPIKVLGRHQLCLLVQPSY